MQHVGFDGGSVLWELGSTSDVKAFFECVGRYAALTDSGLDLSLISDRLYRRYLRLEELDAAAKLMETIKQSFARVNTETVDWQLIGLNPAESQLNIAQPTLADVFAGFFGGFATCVESAKSFFQDWGTYQPVRTVLSDQPWFTAEKNRALVDYDLLDGKPFWLR